MHREQCCRLSKVPSPNERVGGCVQGGLQQGEEQGHSSAVQPSALHDMGGAGAHFLTLLALHDSQLNLEESGNNCPATSARSRLWDFGASGCL